MQFCNREWQPILSVFFLQEFVERNDAWNAVETFAQKHNCDVVVLMGLKEIENGGIRRDIGIVPIKSDSLKDTIYQRLDSDETLQLRLQPKHVKNQLFADCSISELINTRISRKGILPVVQQVINECKSSQ